MLALFGFIVGCATRKSAPTQPSIKALSIQKLGDNHFSGFLVVDPQSNDTLFKHNEQKYFTPASNVKIFTLYMGMKLLPERIPTFRHLERNDTLYLEGTGDPTFLHPEFNGDAAVSFLKSKKNIALHLDNYLDGRYRPGWAWEDYDAYFSPEIGSLPLYGNVVTITQKDSLQVAPDFFKENTFRGKAERLRDERKNLFYLPYTLDTLRIPYITRANLTQKLLQTHVKAEIAIIDSFPIGKKETFYSVPTDSVLKKMMFESDNFLAEQLALVASSQISDTLSFKTAKEYVLEEYLSGLVQMPRWVDGSGLSRYNLFTPESMVQVLAKLHAEFSKERLFSLFPYWNENGTIKKSNGIAEEHFIIAKSGSLGNNYNLSGYLITKSGRILIFSCMNNHFRIPSSEVKKRMQEVFEFIRDTY
ncbi:D-alanyl-D-alanine carboxypeptidase [Allomuricauda sp. d1]|uniref:D-alanyl-D-alanine carboxypeptidase/D-alanyl-D-alanine-endopeptidase n=1 Tax=Allomuricauda sp. d1 TaxID=3136725 RepID=UPI0031E44D23